MKPNKISGRPRHKARLPWTTTKKVALALCAGAGLIAVLLIPWWLTVTCLAVVALCVAVWLCDENGAQLDPQTKGLVRIVVGGVFLTAGLIASAVMESWSDQLKVEAAAETREQVAEYRGVFGPDGEWRYKYTHPLERKVHARLKAKFRENPAREIPDDPRYWNTINDANNQLEQRLVREVAQEFGLPERDVNGIWFKLETRS